MRNSAFTLRKARAFRLLIIEPLESRHLLATLAGRVFEDFNENGLFEPGAGEQAIANTTVYLDLDSNSRLDPGEPVQQTSATGEYLFSGLAAGAYTIRQQLAAATSQVFPAAASRATSLISVPTRDDHLFDQTRSLAYVLTTTGRIERYDVTTNTLLEPFHNGAEFEAADITPDGKYLYAAERQPGAVQGFIRKIDLGTGQTVANIKYDRAGDFGTFDIAIANNGKALVTTDFDGSGGVQLRELDLATDTLSQRTDKPTVRQRTHLARNASRDTIFLMESNSSALPVSVYDATSDSFTANRDFFLGGSLDQAHAAVSRDGTLIAMESFVTKLQILGNSPALPTLFDIDDIPHQRGGLVFDPIHDVLYTVDTNSDEVVAYETTNFAELFRVPIGENIEPPLGFFADPLPVSISDDGRYLFVTSPSGLRMIELFEPSGHAVSIGGGDTISNLHFGNHVADFAAVAEADDFKVASGATNASLNLTANDIANRHGKTVASADSFSAGGTAVVLPNGTGVTYTPAPGFLGIETFRYTLTDPVTSMTDTATVTVTVKPLDGTKEIHGFKWNDLNRNGLYDPAGGETPLAGRSIFIDANRNGLLDGGETSTITAADGSYVFTGVPSGTYEIAEVVPAGWEQTHPIEPAFASQLLSVTGAVEHVFDQLRETLYITTNRGFVERYDFRLNRWLEPWEVGVSLGGADITQDHRFLYVAERQMGVTQSFIRKVDLVDGSVTNLRFDRFGLLGGSYDIAIANNGLAKFTTMFDGSGFVPVYQIDLATDEVTRRPDIPNVINSVEENTQISRSADRGLLFLAEGNTNAGSIRTYEAATDTFPEQRNTGWFLDKSNSAVERNGNEIAFQSDRRGFSTFDPLLDATLEIFPNLRAGVAYDPLRDRLYGADQTNHQIVAYASDSSRELFRIDAGDNLAAEARDMSISPDGKRLFLTTANGVRVYEIALAAPHDVVVNGDDLALQINFGNVEVDRDPLAVEDRFVVQMNSANVTLDVLANDVVAPDDTKTISDVGQTSAGALVSIAGNGQTLSYTPQPGFTGVDSFNYLFEVLDGRTHSTTATVVVKDIDGHSLLRGQKWNDLNGNGAFDPAEAPLAGVTVYLDENGNQQFDAFEDSRVTDNDGRYEFDVLPGTYDIREVAPANSQQTFPLALPGASVPITVANVVEHVYDDATGILFMATSSGRIERYDVANQTLLLPWQVGVRLSGMDINEEGTYLYATELKKVNSQGVIRKVAIADGSVTDIAFNMTFFDDGLADISIAAGNRAFFTANTIGSGLVPLREIDLTNDSITIRADSGDINVNTHITRGQDRSVLHFTEGNSSAGPMFNYLADTDTFSTRFDVFSNLGDANASVNPDGTRIVQQSGGRGMSLFDLNDITWEIFRPLLGGVVFDPIRDRFYAGDIDTNELAAFDTNTGDTLFRVPVVDTIYNVFSQRREMSISRDGNLVFLQTVNGIRMFDLGAPGGHRLTVGADEIIEQLDFGNQLKPDGVVARHIYYHGSTFHGDDPADAIAHDKVPLLPGETASSANFTNYARGINGLIIDIAANAPLTVDDFEFRVGNDNDSLAWQALPGEPTISSQDIDGNNGLDRIIFFFPEEIAPRNSWLEITVLANSRTGLQQNDVFYFGNKIGDSTGDGLTNASDFVDTRRNPSNFLNPAAIDDTSDFNRDRRVDALDLLIVRDHSTNASQALNLITPASGSRAKRSIVWSGPPKVNDAEPESIAGREPKLEESATTGNDDEIRIAALTLLARELAVPQPSMPATGSLDDADQELIVLEDYWENTLPE